MNVETDAPIKTVEDQIRELLPDLVYIAEFVPFSRSRCKDEKDKNLNWRIKLATKAGKLETDYTVGVGHIPNYDQMYARRVDGAAYYSQVCEIGKYSKAKHPGRAFLPHKLPPPKLADVLHSLVSDSDAIDYPNYEEWARNFGYDVDSRKGEAVYRACIECGLALRSMVGDANLAKLREVFQDY